MSSSADLTPQEIATALAARRELGPEYEDAIASALAEKMAKEINARVDAELVAQGFPADKSRPGPKPPRRPARDAAGTGGSSTALAVVSLVAGIPITAIAGGTSHGNVAAIGISWLGIALVNMAHALSRRNR
jgi:hypothetical protein